MQLYFTTCACGCGSFLSPLAHYRRKSPRRFINGHNGHKRSDAPLKDRFWKHVIKSPTCWLWAGTTDGNGYGKLNEGARKGGLLAHRVSWEVHFGPIPDGLFVCHHCDNPPCVRPDHLFLGTQRDNMADMSAKGRAVGGRQGIRHHYKYSVDVVEQIARHRAAGLSHGKIAKILGIPQVSVSRILRGAITVFPSGAIATYSK